jgi:hypothetical protein
MDDIAIIVKSKSIAINNAILKEIAEKLIQKGKNQCIKFDMAKTELIHFHNRKCELLLEITGVCSAKMRGAILRICGSANLVRLV